MHPVSLYTDEYKKAATKNVTALSLFLFLISYFLLLISYSLFPTTHLLTSDISAAPQQHAQT